MMCANEDILVVQRQIKIGDGTSIMHVVNNVFLPRKLPQSAMPTEGEFVRKFAQVLWDDVSDDPALKLSG